MQSAVINFTTEEKTKQDAQKVAKKMGISLSTVLNNYLKHFVRTKRVVFSAEDETPNQWLINALKESEEDEKAGRVTTFKTPREALDYLDKEIADEKRKLSSH
ncbi:MAG: type II toxin-antitoxin system RelB/DinJ family antitoxin [Candidatus Levybacteria bacterium]|nr:type II toxin-antitoxin system RelB/DinJ family antitoxin [Candidatus Levybacteria bacterium]